MERLLAEQMMEEAKTHIFIWESSWGYYLKKAVRAGHASLDEGNAYARLPR